MRYREDVKFIWNEFVPDRGQSDTMQGELLRAVEKLADEAQRNANFNWDPDFERLVSFIDAELSSSEAFSNDQKSFVKTATKRLLDHKDPYQDNDLYDELSDLVVLYFRFHGSKHRKLAPDLRR